jgi:hypothetical protein
MTHNPNDDIYDAADDIQDSELIVIEFSLFVGRVFPGYGGWRKGSPCGCLPKQASSATILRGIGGNTNRA